MKSVEEKVAILDKKIEKKRGEIEALEAQKKKLLHPITIKSIIAKAQEAGMTPEEISEKLGIEI